MYYDIINNVKYCKFLNKPYSFNFTKILGQGYSRLLQDVLSPWNFNLTFTLKTMV